MTICTSETPNAAAEIHNDAKGIGFRPGGKACYKCPNCEREWFDERMGETPSFIAQMHEGPATDFGLDTEPPIPDPDEEADVVVTLGPTDEELDPQLIEGLRQAGYEVRLIEPNPYTPARTMARAQEALDNAVEIQAVLVIVMVDGKFAPFLSATSAERMLAIGRVAMIATDGSQQE